MPGPDSRLGGQLIDEVTYTLGRLRTFAVFAPHYRAPTGEPGLPRWQPLWRRLSGHHPLCAWGGRPSPLRCASPASQTHELVAQPKNCPLPTRISAPTTTICAAALARRLAQGIERTELHTYKVTQSPSAYVSYLLGCEALRLADLRSLRRAKSHFREALKLSEFFVAARAMLARTLCLEWVVLDRNEREPIERAIALAREAVEIDPMDPGAHREIGHAMLYLGAIDEGVESLRTATQLGPHSADALFHYGDGLVHLGEMKEARRVMDTALSLNPLAPDVYHWVSATADYFLGDYPAASRHSAAWRTANPPRAWSPPSKP